MPASRRGFGSMLAALVVLGPRHRLCLRRHELPDVAVVLRREARRHRPAAAGATGSGRGDLVIVGRIVTMDEPPIAEALLIEAGLVTCVGTRDEVLALAGEEVPVVDIGSNVAYPGFIDAHAHWIGDRDYYGIDSAEAAMDAALTRGWTSISRAMGQPGAPRRARGPGRRRRPAASRRRVSRPELRHGLLRRLVRVARARPGRRPPPRPGVEDPPGQWLGHDRALGAR